MHDVGSDGGGTDWRGKQTRTEHRGKADDDSDRSSVLLPGVLRCKLRVRCVPADRKTLLHQNTLDKFVDIVAQLWSGSRSKFIRRFGAGRAVNSYMTLERVAQYIHTSL
jgi:hypothetical protein